MENTYKLHEDDYFLEVYGEWSGHGLGTMLTFRNDTEQFVKWVLYRDEETNRVEVLDPDLYELYLDHGTEEWN